MQYRQFKNKNLSLLGLGAMRLPHFETDKEIDYEKSQEMIDYAIENGVNYFDTAWMYHEGLSQNFLGQALNKYDRTSFNLANKLPLYECTSAEIPQSIFDIQLQKCKVDYFDFYLLHNVNRVSMQLCAEQNLYSFMKKVRDEGKVKHVGFSFHDSPEQLERALDAFPETEFVQIQFNYLDWQLQNANRTYEICQERNKQVIIMEPVRGGMLANPPLRAQKVFENSNYTCAGQALRYVANFSNVACILSGMSNATQLEQNIKTLSEFTPLTPSEEKMFIDAREAILTAGAIPCTTCRYCTSSCPQGIAIPEIFSIYNDHAFDHDAFRTRLQYFTILKDEKRSDNCIKCGVCSERCPQHIDIPSELERVHNCISKLVLNPPVEVIRSV